MAYLKNPFGSWKESLHSTANIFLSYFQGKPMKEDMSLEEAADDSQNLTDFLLDFDEDE